MDFSSMSDADLASIAGATPAPPTHPDAFDPSAMSDAELAAVAGGRPLTIHAPPKPVAGPTDDAGLYGDGTAPDDTYVGDFDVSKANALTARTALRGAAMGFLGLPAMIEDAGINAAYGAKKLAANAGLADAPDPANYYGKGAPEGIGGYFPTGAAASQVADMVPNAMGLRQAVTPRDRIAQAAGEGALSAVTGVGAGQALAKLPQFAKIGGFLANQPLEQVAAGGLSSGGSQMVAENGGDSTDSTLTGGALGLLPFLAARAGSIRAQSLASNVRTAAGRDNAAAEVVQRIAANPAKAADAIDTTKSTVPNVRHDAVTLAQDPGLNSAYGYLNTLDQAKAGQRFFGNNAARMAHMERAGFNDPMKEDLAYHEADTAAQNDKPLVLSGQDPISSVPILKHFRDMAKDPLQTDDVQSMAKSALDKIRSRSKPVYGMDAKGNTVVTDLTIHPEELHTAKQSFLDPYSRPPVDGASGYTLNTKRQVFSDGGAKDMFDQHIESGAPGYLDYQKKQATMRRKADQLNVGNTLLDKSTDPILDTSTGEATRVISPKKFLEMTRPNKLDNSLSKGNRLGVNDLTPKQQRVVNDLNRDLQLAGRKTARGSGAVGSNTYNKQDLDRMVTETAHKYLTGTAKTLGHVGTAARTIGPALVGYAAAHGIGGAKLAGFSLAAGEGGGALQRTARGFTPKAAAGIRERLGQAMDDPNLFKGLLRKQVISRPGLRPYAGLVGDAAVNAGRGNPVGAMFPMSPDRKKRRGG